MPPLAIGGAISAGGSILQGILGGNAAGNAAGQLAAAGQKAATGQTQAGQTAQNDLTQQIATERATEQPFLSAGQGAVTNLSQLLGPGGPLTQGYTNFSAPTDVTMQNDPGYQFRINQGLQALQNSAAARGGLLSTGTAKNLIDYSQGAASQEYGNVFNRALQSYGTNFNTFQANQGNLYNRLMGLTGVGANAATNLNNVTSSGTQSLANLIVGNQQLVGNDIMGIGNAQAAGTVGQANAYGGALGNAANTIGGTYTLAKLLGAQNASNSGVVTDPFS